MARDQEREDAETPIEVLVGQLFVVQPDPTLDPREAFHNHRQNFYGGFFLRRENMRSVERTRRFCDRLRNYWRRLPPPIVAVDEEGGLVNDTGHLTTGAPSARALGVVDDLEVTRDTYEGIGRKLRALGINTVFGPVLDVNSEPGNPVIGTRAFGSETEAVVKHGTAALEGLRAAGIANCPKHFPGHGATSRDSHVALPVVKADRDTLMTRDLEPFIQAIEKCTPDLMMTAHVVYPGLGDSKRPATLSRKILRDVLRGELGFKGVVISDAMEMKGVTDAMPPAAAAVEAILAGVDLLLYAHDRGMADAAYKGVLEAVQKGVISSDRLEESVERILHLRRTFTTRSWMTDDEAEDALRYSEEQVFFENALAAVGVEGNAGVLSQIAAATGPKIVFLPRDIGEYRPMPLDMVREQLEPEGFQVLDVTLDPTPEEISRAEIRASEASVVVVGTASRGEMSEASRKLVEVVTRRDVIKVGVALLDPADADRMMSANCRLKTYGVSVPQLWAMCQKLMVEPPVASAPRPARLPSERDVVSVGADGSGGSEESEGADGSYGSDGSDGPEGSENDV